MEKGTSTTIYIIIAVVIAVVIGGIILTVVTSQTETLTDAVSDSNQDMAMLVEAEYSLYDSNDVNGSTLTSLIRKEQDSGGSFIIVVTTNNGTTQYISSGSVTASTYTITSGLTAVSDPRAALTSAKDENSSTYINPNAMFDCNLLYDSTDALRGVIAVQN